MKKIMITLFLACSGCFSVGVYDPGAKMSGQIVEQHENTFLWGLVGSDDQAVCPIAKVETEHSALSVIASIFTFGIYQPIKVTTVCRQP